MATLDRLTVYPVKGLDGEDLDRVAVRPGGTLAFDREYALFDADGEVINGKRTDRIHRLATGFDPETSRLHVDPPRGHPETFDLDSDRDRAADWFGEYFDREVTLERDRDLGYVDRRSMGPSVVSTATIETVAGWFEDLTAESVRRRLRANVEVGGVEPFWEDRLVGSDAPAMVAGDVCIEGVTPCGRCVVPQRDPDTGEETPDFRERFLEKRRETFPDWAERDAFDHLYSLMVIARIPDSHRDGVLRVDDGVALE